MSENEVQVSKTEPEIVDPKRVRSSLRILQQAVENGWDIPQNIIDVAPRVVASILSDRNTAIS